MKIRNRVLAILFVALLLVSILYSYEYIIEHARHECLGEECLICIQVEEAIQFITNLKYVPILSFIMAVFCVSKCFYRMAKKLFVLKQTLISLKVELVI